MNERLKELRSKLDLSQDEFGERIGVKRSHISSMESGVRRINDRMIKDICREYNVSELWLKAGVGDMFISDSSDVLETIAPRFNLDEDDKAYLRVYLDSNEFERKIIKDFALKIARNIYAIKGK
jgi:transcriptional regulator with XRE-family HTH domain